MKNVFLTKYDNGKFGVGTLKYFTAPDDFRPEDVTEDYDKLEIVENGRVVYRKVNGIVVYEG